MAFRVFSLARRVSRPQPSLMHYGSRHLLGNCTSSSPLFNRLTQPLNSRVKFIHLSPVGTFEPSLMHKGSQHLLRRFTSSSSLLNTLDRDQKSFSAIKRLTGKKVGREFKDLLEKLNDKAKEVERKIMHMKEDSAEFENLAKSVGKSEELWRGYHRASYELRMEHKELVIAKKCAEFEEMKNLLERCYLQSVILLLIRGCVFALVFGTFYKVGQLLKPADDVST